PAWCAMAFLIADANRRSCRMPAHPHTAVSTFKRVAIVLTHREFAQLAGAIRERSDRILKRWRAASLKAMPHLGQLTLKEFENSIATILAALAEALQSEDPQQLRGLMEQSPEHGVDRFKQEGILLDLFEEV